TTFCPGCGYEIFINCFLRAIEALGKRLDDYSFTAGIGCSAWIPNNYFRADNFHTAHGRAIPAAIGLKLANPDLEVITIGGDGDLASIGGNHLIHAIRKNTPIAVFCLNNYLYGMTGGQVGPTTPIRSRTSTTPDGNAEEPFDLVKLVLSVGGGYASRYPTAYPHLLKKGIETMLVADGFRFMEVVSQCPRQYGSRNELSTASRMIAWQREHYLSKEKTRSLSSSQVAGKFVFGNFGSSSEYVKLLPEEQ
ncbi:MAG: thiamine pyrophosphate-dependent enzyme, partial [Dehalococcoidia bacterium]